MKFIELLNNLMNERGTQARCSEGTGIAQSLLSNYRKGKAEPSLTNAVLIADFFDVSLDWLAGRDGYDRDSHKRGSPTSPLPPDESGLLDDYRSMTPRGKTAICEMASTLADGGMAKNQDVGRAEGA